MNRATEPVRIQLERELGQARRENQLMRSALQLISEWPANELSVRECAEVAHVALQGGHVFVDLNCRSCGKSELSYSPGSALCPNHGGYEGGPAMPHED